MIIYSRVKRIFDVIFSVFILFLIIFIVPIIPIICLLIFFDSPGSVFYFQKRIGKNKTEFDMIKFRSMYTGSDEKLRNDIEAGLINPLDFKEASKEGYTRVGMILRKTSLDELPQLFNVIKGEMSIIGPRPIQQFEIDRYIHEYGATAIEKIDTRNSILPGLICYWQVNKNKNSMSFAERMELDDDYVKNMSLSEDIKIFIQGIFTVIRLGNH